MSVIELASAFCGVTDPLRHLRWGSLVETHHTKTLKFIDMWDATHSNRQEFPNILQETPDPYIWVIYNWGFHPQPSTLPFFKRGSFNEKFDAQTLIFQVTSLLQEGPQYDIKDGASLSSISTQFYTYQISWLHIPSDFRCLSLNPTVLFGNLVKSFVVMRSFCSLSI